MDDIAADLARCHVLADTSPDERAELAELLRPKTAPAGAVLFRAGDVADSFLLLTGGRVRIEVDDHAPGTGFELAEGSVVGEVALLRGAPHSVTVTALTEVRFLAGGREAFRRLVQLPGVTERLVREARQRRAAGLRPVALFLRDGAPVGLRPVVPDDRRPVLADASRSSGDTLYRRFFRGGRPSSGELLHLADADYVDHFAWVALDASGVPVGEASYFRTRDDPAEAEISLWLPDDVQGRGLGTLLMGALAVAARHNGVQRFIADVLADNRPMRAVLNRAGVRWGSVENGVVHGVAPVPEPALFGLGPRTVADLDAAVGEVVFPPCPDRPGG